MPTAQIDTTGISLYYEDTGVPNGATRYTTFVLVHGLGINGGELSQGDEETMLYRCLPV